MKRKNAAATPEAQESGKMTRREKAFSRFFAILLILTLVLTMGFFTYKQYGIERDSAYASLRNSMYSLRSLITFEGSLGDAFINLRDSETLMYAELAQPFFDYLGVSAETLEACKYNWEADDLYYFPDEGDVITTEKAEPFSLNKSQTRMLKTLGMLSEGELVYNATRLKHGWLFIKWTEFPNIYSVDFPRIADAVPSSLYIVENTTGEIMISSSETPYNFLDESQITYD